MGERTIIVSRQNMISHGSSRAGALFQFRWQSFSVLRLTVDLGHYRTNSEWLLYSLNLKDQTATLRLAPRDPTNETETGGTDSGILATATAIECDRPSGVFSV